MRDPRVQHRPSSTAPRATLLWIKEEGSDVRVECDSCGNAIYVRPRREERDRGELIIRRWCPCTPETVRIQLPQPERSRTLRRSCEAETT